MKTTKLISAIMLLATVIFSFNACRDDDNENNEHLSGKSLIKMTMEERWGSAYFNFQYANGKLTEMTLAGDDDEISYVFNYSGNTVTVTGEDGAQTFKLNNAGYVESATGGFTFEYNKDGYLTKVLLQNDYWDEETSLFYDNEDNLILANHISKHKYSGRTETDEKNQVTFTPSNYPTKGKYFFFLGGDICPLLGDIDYFWAVYYAGLLGKDPKSLTSKIKIIEDKSGYNVREYERNFTYTLYDDGYIRSMIIDSNEFDDYVPEWMKMSFSYE